LLGMEGWGSWMDSKLTKVNPGSREISGVLIGV
jgi:hypothetical protein